jgi:glutamate dehydrogenase (NAD(P)+)
MFFFFKGTGTREMDWLKDEYCTYYGNKDVNASACVTGKSEYQGGVKGRFELTGYGIFQLMDNLLKNEWFCEKYKLTKGFKGKTLIVQVTKPFIFNIYIGQVKNFI